jgi:hypothetical protein
MQAIIEKIWPNMSMEERWTEILAASAMLWFPVLLAAVGFMFGPIFTPYNNNLADAPGRAHYSLEAAVIGLVVGFVISGSLFFYRYKAKRAEEAQEAHDHAEHH